MLDQPPKDLTFAGAAFDNSYAKLPNHFYARVNPVPVSKPSLIKLNHSLAEDLGLDAEALNDRKGMAVFAGNFIPQHAKPIATAYAGHQFGTFISQLGDGRAILLGEIIDPKGVRRDIQLKGSGPTPFSRGGDGRAPLGPVIREYIVSEAMNALRIPTTRSLAAVTTGEPVFRETTLPGAIITRVASSHIRVGNFEYFAARGDKDSTRQLADYVINRHFPLLKETGNPYLALLEEVMDGQSSLIAKWMNIGFIHGVMNTDNMTISGETIDYGPCAFMDTYAPATVFSYIDHQGRYAFGNQPHIGRWNLTRFAETLLPLLDPDVKKAVKMAEGTIASFPNKFQKHWLDGMRKKLGLFKVAEDDQSLVDSLLELMNTHAADYTLTFRTLCDAAQDGEDPAQVHPLLPNNKDYQSWSSRWRERLNRESIPPTERASAMRSFNPAFIPRNHRVEQAIQAAVDHGDFSKMDDLLDVLSNPYKDQEKYASHTQPPKPEERIQHTFCGT